MIRFALTGVLTICVMAVGPAAASASTISSDGTTITVSAGAGEQNKLQFSSYKGHIEITDSAGATPGAGCSPGITGYSGYSVACPAGPTAARVDLGDGDDLMQIGPDPGLAFTVSGGPGNDDIDTGTRNDVVDGGPGRDHIETYEGDDHVEAADGEHDFISCDAVAHPSGGNDSARVDVGVGADASDEVQDCEQVDRVFAGGGVAAQVTGKPAPNSGDSPRLDYGGAPGAANDVSLTLEDNNWVLREPGGLAASGDCVRRSPTEVACPRHGPTLIAIDLGDGNDRAATDTPFPASPEKLDTPYVFGGAGDDTITGGPGGEALLGDDGNDTLRGGDNADRLEGGNGNDTLDGGAGSDQLLGLAGDDHLIGGTGLDFFDPGEATDRGKNASGTDTFDARDGDADALNCDGHDRATLDRLDDVSGCKHPKVGDTRPRASFTVKPVGLVLKAPARGGKFKLRLRCPRNARPGCAGGVRVGDIRAAFNIKPGRTVAIPIAESRSYGNTRGTRIRMDDPLYVVTHDEAGHTRTLKLRLTLLFT